MMQPGASDGRPFLPKHRPGLYIYTHIYIYISACNSYREITRFSWFGEREKRTCLGLITNLLLSLSSLSTPAPHPLIK